MGLRPAGLADVCGVDPAPPMGTPVNHDAASAFARCVPVVVAPCASVMVRGVVPAVAFVVLLSLLVTRPAQAADRFVVLVSGASAGAPYAEKYDGWRNAFVATLKQ